MTLTLHACAQDIGPQSSADAALSAAGAVQAQSVPPGNGAMAAGALPLSFGGASYDARTDALTITGVGHQLACPNGLKVTWMSGTASAAAPVAPAATPAAPPILTMPSIVSAPFNAPSFLTAAG
jgi:hypothetical protein